MVESRFAASGHSRPARQPDAVAKPYLTGYEPIWDASDNVIGVYYVGYALK